MKLTLQTGDNNMNTEVNKIDEQEAIGFVASSLGMTMYDNMVKDDPYLTRHDVEVYGCLCRFADARTNSTYISVEPTMCDYTGIGRTTILASLKNLEEAGYITKQIRTTPNGGRLPSLYTVVSLEGKEPRYPISESKFYRNHKESYALTQQAKRQNSTASPKKLSDTYKETVQECKNNTSESGAESTHSKRGEVPESTRSKRGDVEPKVHAAYSNKTKTLKTLNNHYKKNNIKKAEPALPSNQGTLFDIKPDNNEPQPVRTLQELHARYKTPKARSDEMFRMLREGLISADDYTMLDLGYYYVNRYNEKERPRGYGKITNPRNEEHVRENIEAVAQLCGATNNKQIIRMLDAIVDEVARRVSSPADNPVKQLLAYTGNKLSIGCLKNDYMATILEHLNFTFSSNTPTANSAESIPEYVREAPKKLDKYEGPEVF